MNQFNQEKNIPKEIIQRICTEVGSKDFIKILTEKLSFSDLTSVLLEVYKNKIKILNSSDILKSYRQNRFVKPSELSPLTRINFEKLAFSLLPEDVEIIDLSPVTVLGTCSSVANVNQNNILTALRGTEVVSDSTNVLALECAARIIKHQESLSEYPENITLCSSHRLLRTQLFDQSDSFSHFLILSLVTSGKDSGSFQFEYKSLTKQLDYYFMLMENLPKINLFSDNYRLKLIYFSNCFMKFFKPKISSYLQEKFPKLKVIHELFNGHQNYYQNLRFQFFATTRKKEEYFLLDGGFTDWTQKLLNNRKERFLISGLGSERLLTFFR